MNKEQKMLPKSIKIGECELDVASGIVVDGNRSTKLGPKSVDILIYFAEHPGQLVSRDQLMDSVWPDLVITESQIPKRILEIRNALGDHDEPRHYIETLIGRGFRLICTTEIVGSQTSDAGAQPVTAPAQNRRLVYALVGLVLLMAGFQIADRFLTDQSSATLAGNPVSNSSDSSTQVVRSTVSLGDLLPIQSANARFGLRSVLSISADGSRFSYTSSNGNNHQFYIRDLDQLEPRPLGSPSNGLGGLSPDGEWVFFSKGRNLWKMSVNEDLTQLVTEGFSIPGSFSIGEGNTVYFTGVDEILRQVPASGGESELLGIPDVAGMNRQYWPHSLPEGKALLFTRANRAGDSRIELFNLETRDSRALVEAAYHASYSPTGHITFIREGSLWAVPFDLDNLLLSGPEVMLIEGIEALPFVLYASYSLSDSGKLIYIPDIQLQPETAQRTVLAWVDRTGAETVLDMEPQIFTWPKLSPDGNRVSLTISKDFIHQSMELWTYDLERGTLSRITYSGDVWSPLWTADGERLIYGTPQGIRSISSTGIGQIEELSSITEITRFTPLPTSISPDGQKLLFSDWHFDQGGVQDIQTLNLTPEYQSAPLINSEFTEFIAVAVISPDGRWVAYMSAETGRAEVYVRPYPNVEADKWKISTEGGAWPLWAPSGEELFYRRGVGAGENQTLVVAIESEPEFSAGKPQLLFTSDHINNWGGYTVSADGQRFLMLKPPSRESLEPVAIPTNVVLVDNFDEELKRLVPADPQ